MDLGLGEVLGTRTRRQGVGINKYINNHLGFIFLGDMGGDLGSGRTCGQGEGCRYQHVHKQPFRLYLFRRHGGDLGLGRTWGQGDRV